MSDHDANECVKSVKVAEAFAQASAPPVASEIILDDILGARPSGPTLTFNVAEYLSYLEGSELTDAQKRELLEAVWHIVVSFVEFGFGSHPIQQAMDNSKIIDGVASEIVIESGVSHCNNKKNTSAARSRGVPRERGIHEPF